MTPGWRYHRTVPTTVPFIMALGVGFAAVRSDRHAEDDSFGLVALCSIGPILAVMILGLLCLIRKTPATLPYSLAGNFKLCGTMEVLCRRVPGIHAGNCKFPAAPDCPVFCCIPDDFIKIKEEKTTQNHNWNRIHLHRPGSLPYRCKCRIYAGRKPSRADDSRSSGPISS